MKGLKISENRRYLTLEDGTPFFWLGDTAWELFHKLNREEALHYLNNRAERKFTVIQAVALAESEGIEMTNAYGRKPFIIDEAGVMNLDLPDVGGGYDYWQHIDFIVDSAAESGLYMALLPAWGDKINREFGKGPEIFDEGSAYRYGRWLGERYKDRKNIVWVLGGDRLLTKKEHFAVVTAMAQGLADGDGGCHLRTFHPYGGYSSSYHFHVEPWLDFNMVQSGHAHRERDNYLKITEDYAREPFKPVVDAEPCYEDHPRGMRPQNGYFDEADVRTAAYYAVLSGAFGHTYGHHSIWSMTTEPGNYYIMHWKDALHRPGAAQMQHVRALMESFPDRVPDQSLIAGNDGGCNYLVAARGKNRAMIYSPNGIRFKVVMDKLSGKARKAFWYNPRNGQSTDIGKFANESPAEFVPPLSGRGSDWVLVLDMDQ